MRPATELRRHGALIRLGTRTNGERDGADAGGRALILRTFGRTHAAFGDEAYGLPVAGNPMPPPPFLKKVSPSNQW